jgi:hypothetical protein
MSDISLGDIRLKIIYIFLGRWLKDFYIKTDLAHTENDDACR